MSLIEFGDVEKKSPLRTPPPPPISATAIDGMRNEPTRRAEGDVCQYALMGGLYHPATHTIPSLPPGAYGMVSTNQGLAFQSRSLNVDELIEFPGSRHAELLKEVQDFWARKDVFQKHGFLHRRGYLFYGPAGGGKTSMIQQIVSEVIKGGDLVFIMDTNPAFFRSGLHLFRIAEPDRRLVCIFEDLDAIIDRHGEDEMLSVLDGEQQIDSVLNIATTNYPERLDKRIVARPRRFDRIIRVGMPTQSMRKVFFSRKLQVDDAELDRWVLATDQFSFAACAELVITVLCLGNDFDKSAKRLLDMLTSTPKSTDASNIPVGFGAGPGHEDENV